MTFGLRTMSPIFQWTLLGLIVYISTIIFRYQDDHVSRARVQN